MTALSRIRDHRPLSPGGLAIWGTKKLLFTISERETPKVRNTYLPAFLPAPLPCHLAQNIHPYCLALPCLACPPHFGFRDSAYHPHPIRSLWYLSNCSECRAKNQQSCRISLTAVQPILFACLSSRSLERHQPLKRLIAIYYNPPEGADGSASGFGDPTRRVYLNYLLT